MSARQHVGRFAAVVVLAGGIHAGTGATDKPDPDTEEVVVHVDNESAEVEVAVGEKTFTLNDLEPWTETGSDEPEQMVLAAWAYDTDPSQADLDEIADASTTTSTTASTAPEPLAPLSAVDPTELEATSNETSHPSNQPPGHDGHTHTPGDNPELARPEHDHSVEAVPWREEIFDTEPPTDLTSAIERLEEATEIAEQAETELEERENILEVADGMVVTLEGRVAQRHKILLDVEDQTRQIATAMYVRGQTPPPIFDEIDASTEPLVERQLNELVVDETVDLLVATTDAYELSAAQRQIAHEVHGWAEAKRDETAQVLEEAEAAVDEAEAERAKALASMTRGTGNLASVPATAGPAIQVDVNLAPALAALMDQARTDGIPLGGWGWRSPARTAELRIINGCPDVDVSPPSACATPTARPGTSMHEQGLAVDFTCNGSTVQRGTRCDSWLMENGPNYGLLNLPSEAWHYSTTGG